VDHDHRASGPGRSPRPGWRGVVARLSIRVTVAHVGGELRPFDSGREPGRAGAGLPGGIDDPIPLDRRRADPEVGSVNALGAAGLIGGRRDDERRPPQRSRPDGTIETPAKPRTCEAPTVPPFAGAEPHLRRVGIATGSARYRQLTSTYAKTRRRRLIMGIAH